MKLKNNRKPKSGKKVKTPSVNIGNDMKEIMEQWQEQQRKEQEELAAQTWPTWLLPEDFEKWYVYEQEWRRDLGYIPLPNPPSDVINQILKK